METWEPPGLLAQIINAKRRMQLERGLALGSRVVRVGLAEGPPEQRLGEGWADAWGAAAHRPWGWSSRVGRGVRR